MDQAKLTLHAEGLLSKWGFSDGDSPDAYLDWCDGCGKPYGDDWHVVLTALVKHYLLPALREHHAVDISEVSTCHNPVRASVIDGEDISDMWSVSSFALPLTPACVEIPMDEVWRLATHRHSA